MIYAPREVFDLRLAILQGIYRAIISAAVDFVAEDNKPWEYYVGVGFGGTAAATGIPGAAATLYVVGEGVDVLFFHSPDGSSVDLFLDGVLAETVDTYLGTPDWLTFSMIGLSPNVLHRLDIVNRVNDNEDKTSPINWLAIGDIEVFGDGAYARKSNNVALTNISYSLLDSDGDTDTFAIKVLSASHTMAQLVEAAQDFAVKLDAVTGSKITDIAVTVSASLPGGLKSSPDSTIENQKGATLSLTLDGSPYRDSLRIPGVKPALFTGKELIVTGGGAGQNLVSMLTDGIEVTADSGATVEPANRFELEYAALASAVKSFRK